MCPSRKDVHKRPQATEQFVDSGIADLVSSIAGVPRGMRDVNLLHTLHHQRRKSGLREPLQFHGVLLSEHTPAILLKRTSRARSSVG
ncbi:MAG: hypothetical protein RLZZ458_3657 [Planctomycetota bacterium]|jgi:hypothetical protein